MLANYRTTPQLTIPDRVAKRAGISAGDRLSITLRDGGIFLAPVADNARLDFVIVQSLPSDANESRKKESPNSTLINNTIGKPVKFGGWEGKITISDNFDAPLDDFEEYM